MISCLLVLHQLQRKAQLVLGEALRLKPSLLYFFLKTVNGRGCSFRQVEAVLYKAGRERLMLIPSFLLPKSSLRIEL